MRIFLGEKDLAIPTTPMDLRSDDHRGKAFGAINPEQCLDPIWPRNPVCE